jgi:Protein of unknown function (DUF2752)
MSQPVVFSEQQAKESAPVNFDRSVLDRPEWKTPERILLAILGLGLLTLLIVAKFLTASPAGFGTHQQLGLPPCTMKYVFGLRCPSCGMTTSWASLLDGDVVGSVTANCGGTLLCLVSLVAVPTTMWMAWSGRGSYQGWFFKFSLVGLLAALGVSLIDWTIRLMAST